jgi:sulfide:quinone oxidoreductase
LQLDWEVIPGLSESVGRCNSSVVSNYGYDIVEKTRDAIRMFRGGTALFAEPVTPIKCGGAPQKIMYLAEETFRKNGVRDKSRVMFLNAKTSLFSSPYYGEALERICAARGIEIRLGHELVELRRDRFEAVVRDHSTKEVYALRYDMINVTPPVSAPDF